MSFFFPVKEDPKPTDGCRRRKDDEVEEEGDDDDDDDDDNERGRAALCAAEHEDKNIIFFSSSSLFCSVMRIFRPLAHKTNKQKAHKALMLKGKRTSQVKSFYNNLKVTAHKC